MPSLSGRGLYSGGLFGGGLWNTGLWGGNAQPPVSTGPVTPQGWSTADLLGRLKRLIGRGNGGAMLVNDELWPDDKFYELLADAEEAETEELIPYCPYAFKVAPVKLTTSDGGVTYDFPSYPYGGVEIYAQLADGRELFPSAGGFNGCGDFLLEGQKIRAPGNQVRAYADGPWAVYSGLPVGRISATVEPSMQPPQARELLLYRAAMMSCDVWAAQQDDAQFEKRHSQARTRWVTLWQTQSARTASGYNPALGNRPNWWQFLSYYR